MQELGGVAVGVERASGGAKRRCLRYRVGAGCVGCPKWYRTKPGRETTVLLSRKLEKHRYETSIKFLNYKKFMKDSIERCSNTSLNIVFDLAKKNTSTSLTETTGPGLLR